MLINNKYPGHSTVTRSTIPAARFRPICQLCAYSYSAGFIHHQTNAHHRHALAKRIFFLPRALRHCRLSPAGGRRRRPSTLPLLPRRQGSSGSDRRRRRQLRIIAATCRHRLRRQLPKCCSPRATQRRHPWERGSAPGDERQEETSDLSYPGMRSLAMYSLNFSWAILLSCMLLASVVVGCPVAKAEK